MKRFTALNVPIALLFLCILPASSLDLQNPVDAAGADGLSSCVTSCLQTTLDHFNCDTTGPCFCENSPGNAAIEKCLETNCSTEDQLATKKFQADECGFPVRSQQMSTDAAIWALFALACFFATLRLVNRSPQTGGAGYWWDDYSLWLTCVPMITFTVLGYVARQHGIGKDMWESSVANVVQALKFFWAAQILYILTVYGTKISFLLLYLRIWKDDSTFRLLCWIGIGVVSTAFVAFEFATIFQCVPVSYNWTSFLGVEGFCDHQAAQAYTNAAFNILFDVAILILPLRTVYKLELNLAKKVGLGFVFLVGWLVVVCACIRLRYLVRYEQSGMDNITWDSNYIGLWSTIEALLGIICVCIPTSAGVAHRSLAKFGGRKHIKDLDEKSLTERPTRTLRTSAIVENSSLTGDVESAAGKEVVEEVWSGSNATAALPRMSESSGDMEQVAKTLEFQDRTMPAVEEQRRKAAAKKVVADMLRKLEMKHIGRAEPSSTDPEIQEASLRPTDGDGVSASALDQDLEHELHAERLVQHKTSMLPCEDPPPPPVEADERVKERASASSGIEPNTRHFPERPGGLSRRLSSRSAQSESAAGSTHAFFDNVNTEPFFSAISPEEARHRADLKEFQSWRTILPSAIPLRDEDVGRSRRDRRRPLSNARSLSSQSRTRASSCESSGDVLEPMSPLKNRSQATSTLYDEAKMVDAQQQSSEQAPESNSESSTSLQPSATYEPSADLVEPPAAFEVEHMVSDTSLVKPRQEQHRPSGMSMRHSYRKPAPRNSDGSTSTNDESHQSHGVSLSFEGSQKISESNTPADEHGSPFQSLGGYMSPYHPRQLYRNSDGSTSTAVSDQHPLRSQGMSGAYHSNRHSYFDNYRQPVGHSSHREHVVSPYQQSPYDTNDDSSPSPVISPPEQMMEYRPAPMPLQHSRERSESDYAAEYASSIESVPRTSDEESTVRPSTGNRAPTPSDHTDNSEYNDNDEPTLESPSLIIPTHSENSTLPSAASSTPNISITEPERESETIQQPEPQPEPEPTTMPSIASSPSPDPEDAEEKQRRIHAAETVFNIVVESRTQAERISPFSSDSSLDSVSSNASANSSSGSGRRSLGRRSLTTDGKGKAVAGRRRLDFHERSKLFDEEVRRRKKMRRAVSYGMGKTSYGSGGGMAASASGGSGIVRRGAGGKFTLSKSPHVLSPGRRSPPDVSKLQVGDGRELVVGKEQVDLCVSD